jgi:hypothetical protein
MKNIPTAEDFFEQHLQRGVNNTHSNYLEAAKEFAKLHVEAALKAAWSVEYNTLKEFNNCYHLTNIK